MVVPLFVPGCAVIVLSYAICLCACTWHSLLHSFMHMSIGSYVLSVICVLLCCCDCLYVAAAFFEQVLTLMHHVRACCRHVCESIDGKAPAM